MSCIKLAVIVDERALSMTSGPAGSGEAYPPWAEPEQAGSPRNVPLGLVERAENQAGPGYLSRLM